MERPEALKQLHRMLEDNKRYYEIAKTQKRMKQSERALTMAHYNWNMLALEFAIKALTTTEEKISDQTGSVP